MPPGCRRRPPCAAPRPGGTPPCRPPRPPTWRRRPPGPGSGQPPGRAAELRLSGSAHAAPSSAAGAGGGGRKFAAAMGPGPSGSSRCPKRERLRENCRRLSSAECFTTPASGSYRRAGASFRHGRVQSAVCVFCSRSHGSPGCSGTKERRSRGLFLSFPCFNQLFIWRHQCGAPARGRKEGGAERRRAVPAQLRSRRPAGCGSSPGATQGWAGRGRPRGSETAPGGAGGEGRGWA